MKPSDCDCVILCGGFGKRLQGVVNKVPKVMADVHGRPFLDFIIEYLKSQKISRIILAAGYKGDLIEKYYRSHDFGITIDFSTEKEPLGTGGAIKHARGIISSDPFFVLNGDSFLSENLQTFLEFHQQREALASILVSKVKDGQDFGTISLDWDGRIIDFREKIDDSDKALVNAGIYCFSADIFSKMPKASAFSLEKDFFPKLAGGQFFGFMTEQEFVDIGTPERYDSAQNKLKKDK